MARTIGRWMALASAVAALALAAPAALAADHGVDIAGFAFSPGSITVNVGDSVTWTNADAQNHTATADDGSFDTGSIARNASKSVTFSTAGTFAYHCKIHPQMTATVVVADAATAPPTDTALVGASPEPNQPSLAAVVLVAAGLIGWLIARRRFGPVGRADSGR